MAWTKQQILDHKEAVGRLYKIRDEVFARLKEGISEKELQKFILKKFKEHGLKTAPQTPIVAFRENTSFVHYYPTVKKSKKLKPNSLILLDTWASLNKKGAPFADVTFMAFYGNKMPTTQIKLFKTVFAARDKCLNYVKSEVKKRRMPVGTKIDAVARKYIERQGYKNKFPHSLGHALGLNHPHGPEPALSPRSAAKIEKNLGYTIEPGIYLANKFGARSEINFYVDNKNRVVVTTPIQKKIIFI